MALREFSKLVSEKGPSVAGDPGVYMDILSAALSPAQVAANTTAAQEFAVVGAAVGDIVVAMKPTAQAGLALGGAFIDEADKINIVFVNDTAAPITPTAAETYKFFLIRKA